jgi:hypothetical protein
MCDAAPGISWALPLEHGRSFAVEAKQARSP